MKQDKQRSQPDDRQQPRRERNPGQQNLGQQNPQNPSRRLERPITIDTNPAVQKPTEPGRNEQDVTKTQRHDKR